MCKEIEKELSLYDLIEDEPKAASPACDDSDIISEADGEFDQDAEDEEPDTALTIQDIGEMLKANRQAIIERTEIEAYGYSVDEWIEYPESIMNLDSGLAYDVARVLKISVDDIINAIQRESMLSI